MNRLNQVLVGILALQLVVAAIVLWPRSAATGESERLFPDLEAERITGLTITGSDGQSIRLAKAGDEWVLPEAGDYPAEEGKVPPLLEEIAGLGYHTAEGLRLNPPLPDAPYEKISIDWHQLPAQILANQVMPLQDSSGCPFHCRFCNFVKDPRAIFVRPIDDIVDDLKQLQSLGVRYVRFVDDNFRLGKRDLEQVCKRFIKERITIRWLTFLRADAVLQFGSLRVDLILNLALASLVFTSIFLDACNDGGTKLEKL